MPVLSASAATGPTWRRHPGLRTGPGPAAHSGGYLPTPARSHQGHRARRYGRLCETGTLWLLWLRGWDLVGRNLRCGRFELDLLVARGDDLRALEVKARAPGTWVGADLALTFHQRLRLQTALRRYLERVPWPGRVTFQRVSWSGWRWHFHPPERWDALGYW